MLKDVIGYCSVAAVILVWVSVIVRLLSGQVEAQSRWDYTCYKSADALVNFINTQPVAKAEKMKSFHSLGPGYSILYCAIYQK